MIFKIISHQLCLNGLTGIPNVMKQEKAKMYRLLHKNMMIEDTNLFNTRDLAPGDIPGRLSFLLAL